MPSSRKYKSIPTKMTESEFNEFVFPYLTKGSRGPSKKVTFYRIFCYILRVLSTGMKWEDLEIKKDESGTPEIHYTNVFRTYQSWVEKGCFDTIFEKSVLRLLKEGLLDLSVLHGDGTNHVAKKGGDNIGHNGHKKIKGDKIIGVCDRNVNVVAPFISAAGNKNESPLLKPLLKKITQMAKKLGISLKGKLMSLDGIYNSRSNRKAIFNRGMIPNINLRKCDKQRGGRNQHFQQEIYEERFFTIERLFAWEDKFRRLVIRYERKSDNFYAFKTLGYSLINLRHFL